MVWTQIASYVDSVGFEGSLLNSSAWSDHVQSIFDAPASFQGVNEIGCQINSWTDGINYVNDELALIQSGFRVEIVGVVHTKILIYPNFSLPLFSETNHAVSDWWWDYQFADIIVTSEGIV